MLQHFLQQLEKEGIVAFPVRVRPRASLTTITSVLSDGTLKIDLKAPAEDGRANAELVRFLADKFSLSLGHVEIISGKTARSKVVRISFADR